MKNSLKAEITRWSFECADREYVLIVYEDGSADIERLSEYLESTTGSPENRLLMYCYQKGVEAYRTPVTISTELFLLLHDLACTPRLLDATLSSAITEKVLASTPGRLSPVPNP